MIELGSLDPELPIGAAVARRVLELSRSSRRSADAFACAIEHDLGLSARVLRAANAPFHRRSRQLGTVWDAVRVLSLRDIEQILVHASLRAISLRDDPAGRRFAAQALQHGLRAEMIAGCVAPELASIALVAGQLHDVGRFLLRAASPLCFEEAEVAGDRAVFGFTRQEAGAQLLRRWQLPEALEAAALHHLDPAQAPAEQARLVAAVALGAALSRPHPAALEILGIGPAVLSSLQRLGQECERTTVTRSGGRSMTPGTVLG